MTTLICFLTTQCVSASPSAGIEMAGGRELPTYLNIDVPAELGTVDALYEAPASPNPQFILHIQNAHANYQAQIKIKQLLDYMNKKYGFKTIFVEGASEKLDPDYLRLFPDQERNLKLCDELAKQGELTGAELYLMEAGKDIEGLPIEQAALYRSNYEALKKVFGAEPDVMRFFKGFDGKLDKAASKTFTPETRELIADWKRFEQGRREFMPFVQSLVTKSKKILKVDLESLFAQVGWPQITRLLVIQKMEKTLDKDKGLAEKTGLLQMLRTKNVSKELLSALENFNEGSIAVGTSTKEVLPRDVLERLAAEAGPQGFKFSDYPAFSLFAGYVTLRSELDSKVLFDEIEYLFTQMLDTLAQEPEQKSLLTLYRDGELLRKLLHLELNRVQWQQLLEEKDRVAIPSLVARLKTAVQTAELSSQVASRSSLVASKASDQRPETSDRQVMPPKFAKTMDELFTAGLDFYDFAHKREAVFYKEMQSAMAERKITKAILITGGFHTDGMSDMFRENAVSYGIVTPRLSEKSDENMYRSIMLQKNNSTFDISYLEARSRMINYDAQRRQTGRIDVTRIFQEFMKIVRETDLAKAVEHYRGTVAYEMLKTSGFDITENKTGGVELVPTSETRNSIGQPMEISGTNRPGDGTPGKLILTRSEVRGKELLLYAAGIVSGFVFKVVLVPITDHMRAAHHLNSAQQVFAVGLPIAMLAALMAGIVVYMGPELGSWAYQKIFGVKGLFSSPNKVLSYVVAPALAGVAFFAFPGNVHIMLVPLVLAFLLVHPLEHSVSKIKEAYQKWDASRGNRRLSGFGRWLDAFEKFATNLGPATGEFILSIPKRIELASRLREEEFLKRQKIKIEASQAENTKQLLDAYQKRLARLKTEIKQLKGESGLSRSEVGVSFTVNTSKDLRIQAQKILEALQKILKAHKNPPNSSDTVTFVVIGGRLQPKSVYKLSEVSTLNALMELMKPRLEEVKYPMTVDVLPFANGVAVAFIPARSEAREMSELETQVTALRADKNLPTWVRFKVVTSERQGMPRLLILTKSAHGKPVVIDVEYAESIRYEFNRSEPKKSKFVITSFNTAKLKDIEETVPLIPPFDVSVPVSLAEYSQLSKPGKSAAKAVVRAAVKARQVLQDDVLARLTKESPEVVEWYQKEKPAFATDFLADVLWGIIVPAKGITSEKAAVIVQILQKFHEAKTSKRFSWTKFLKNTKKIMDKNPAFEVSKASGGVVIPLEGMPSEDFLGKLALFLMENPMESINFAYRKGTLTSDQLKRLRAIGSQFEGRWILFGARNLDKAIQMASSEAQRLSGKVAAILVQSAGEADRVGKSAQGNIIIAEKDEALAALQVLAAIRVSQHSTAQEISAGDWKVVGDLLAREFGEGAVKFDAKGRLVLNNKALAALERVLSELIAIQATSVAA